MTPSTDLIAAQIARERAWAFDAWMSRLTYAQMRTLSAQPPEHGGLGYELSESALKGLVQGAREERGDLTMGKAERIERQAAEVDEIARHARQRIADAAAIGGMDVHAIKVLNEMHKRESALFGLDEPTKVEAEVNVYDGASQELARMLAEAGIEQAADA